MRRDEQAHADARQPRGRDAFVAFARLRRPRGADRTRLRAAARRHRRRRARDTTSAREPVPDYQSALTGDVRGMKIAVPENYYYDCVTVDVRARLDASLAVFRDQGAAIVRVEVRTSIWSTASLSS